MRLLISLFFSGIVILAAGCSGLPGAAPIEPGPQPAAGVSTVAPALDPVQTGRRLLEAGGRRWLETPDAVFVQQMTYSEAHKWIPMLSEDGDRIWGSQTAVWLVVFKGAWVPTDPPQAEPVTSPGCLLVLFRAADGNLIAAGDSLCPGQQ